jgi:hypothetical protein
MKPHHQSVRWRRESSENLAPSFVSPLDDNPSGELYKVFDDMVHARIPLFNGPVLFIDSGEGVRSEKRSNAPLSEE